MRKEENTNYEKPFVSRIDLALEETLSAGCKVDIFGDCALAGAPTSEPGS